MSRLPRNIIYNLSGQLVLLLLTLLAARLVFRQLGPDALGIILFAQTLNIVLVSIFETGLTATVVRDVAAYRATDARYVRDLVRTYGLLYWMAFAGFAVAVYLFAPLVARGWINLQTVDVATATTVFQILGISALVSLPRALYAGVLRGTQQMGLKNLIDIATSAAQQLGIVIALLLHASLAAAAWWMAGGYLLGLVAYAITAGRLLGWGSLFPGYRSRVVIRTRGFSLRMVAISGLALLHTQIDKVVVSKLLAVSVFGYYAMAASLVARGGVVAAAIGEAAFPSLTEQASSDDRRSLLRRYRALQDLTTYAAVPVFSGIIFVSLPVYGYLFQPAVAQSLLLPTAFLCLGSFMNATMTIPYIYSIATGHPWIAARQNFWALLAVVPATLALTWWFGLAGAAASWVLYHAVAYAYGVPRFCRLIGIGWASWYQQVGRAGAVAAATFGGGWLIGWFGGAGLAGLAGGYLLGAAAFVLAASRMVGPELRAAVRRRLGREEGGALHAAA